MVKRFLALLLTSEVINEALKHNDIKIEDVKLIAPHQANFRI